LTGMEYWIGAALSVVVGGLIGMRIFPESKRSFQPSALFPTPVICLGILVMIKMIAGIDIYISMIVGILTPLLIKSQLNKLCPVVE